MRMLTTASLLIPLCVLLALGVAHAPLEAGGQTAARPATGRREIVHAGLRGCRCTERLRQYLETRPAAADERFEWIEGPGPVLRIFSAAGEAVYTGGYDPAPVWDQAIRRELANGGRARIRPVAGCERRPAETWRGAIRRALQ